MPEIPFALSILKYGALAGVQDYAFKVPLLDFQILYLSVLYDRLYVDIKARRKSSLSSRGIRMATESDIDAL